MSCARGTPAGSAITSSAGRMNRRAYIRRGAAFSGAAGCAHRLPRLLTHCVRVLVRHVDARAVNIALVEARCVLHLIVAVAGALAGYLLLLLLRRPALVFDRFLVAACQIIRLQQLLLVSEPRDFGRIRLIDVHAGLGRALGVAAVG